MAQAFLSGPIQFNREPNGITVRFSVRYWGAEVFSGIAVDEDTIDVSILDTDTPTQANNKVAAAFAAQVALKGYTLARADVLRVSITKGI